MNIMLLNDAAQVPVRGSEGAAGYDLFCIRRVEIPAGCQAKLPTGIAMEIPAGWYGRIAPRSGLATRHGINVHAGVIDCDYRQEISVCLINHGRDMVEFKSGDRIAQIIFEQFGAFEMKVVDMIEPNGRGGFGSTGR